MNSTLRTILFFSFSIFSFSLFAQIGNVDGSVTDSSGNAVLFAHIQIENTNVETNTNGDGKFQLKNVPVGNQKITVQLMGYEPFLQTMEVKVNQTINLNFILKPSSQMLKTIAITGVSTTSGMGRMNEVNDGIIYSGKKNEVIILDSLAANTAQNNPRQVLGRVPGSNYSETEGGGFPSNGIGFRGLNPTQSIETNTRQNGYNLTGDLYGYPESYYLPPLEAVDRIEVTRGASSLQFGPQFGGVINYILKNGNANKPFEFTTQQTGGSYGFYNSFNSAGGTYKKWNYFAYLQTKTSTGWRPNSELKQILGFAKVEYNATEKLKFGLEYSALRNTIQMAGGLDDAQFAADASQSVRARNWLSSPWNILAFTSSYKISNSTLLTFKSALNVSQRNLVWRNEDGGIQTPDSIDPTTNHYVPREVEHEGFRSITNELRLLTNYKIGKLNQTLAVGMRYFNGYMKRQEGGPGSTASNFDLNLYGGNYENDLDFHTSNLAFFFENTFRITKRFSVTPGFRYEYLHSAAKGYITDADSGVMVNIDRSKNRNIALAGIGLQYKTTATTNVYGNISQAYRPTDYSNQTPIGVSSKIDPNLKDASGYNADFGWRGTVKNYLNFDVGAFYLAYNNRIGIETLTDASGNPYTYRTNVANSVHQGLETYVEINLMKIFTRHSKIGELSFFNSFAYINAKYVSGPFKNNWVEFAPNTINRFGISYAYKNISTTFLMSNTSKSFADANNTVYSDDATVGVIPAYQILDWSAAIKIKNYNIKFGINNLADKKYFTLRTDEYPGPGIIPSIARTWYVGFGAKF